MTSSQIKQVDDNFVQPVATQLDAIATKDEQIKSLITSVQDLKQQLASAQQQITANEITIKDMSKKLGHLEDGLDVTRQELNQTTMTGRKMKDELTKQSEEHFRALTKQEWGPQVAALATSYNKLKRNLLTFVVTVTFAIALAFLFLPYNIVHDVEKTQTTNGQDEMRDLHADSLSRMYTLSSDQGLQIQRLNNTLNAMQLQIESESELIAKIRTNISAVNQTTLSVINAVEAHCDQKIMEMRNIVTGLSSKVDVISKGHVSQLQKLTNIEEDLNITKSHVQNKTKIAEVVAELHKNITAVNETTLKIVNDVKIHYNHEIMIMTNLVTNLSSKVDILSNDLINAVEAHCDQKIMEMRNIVIGLSSKVDVISKGQVLQLQKLTNIEEDLNITKSHVQNKTKIAEVVAELHKNITAVNETTLKIVNDVKVHYNHEIMIMTNLVTNLSSKVDILSNDQVLQFQKLDGIEDSIVTKSHAQSEKQLAKLVAELQNNIRVINETAMVSISELKAQQITLHNFWDYQQYRKELTIETLQQLEKSLAKSNASTFTAIVMVSHISSVVNSMQNNHWAKASIYIRGEVVSISFQKISNKYFKVILCEPLPLWCYNLSIKNQIKDSSHYKIGSILSMERFITHRTRINKIKSKQHMTECISFTSKPLKFEELLKVTFDCQYVLCDSVFISMECDDLNLEFKVSS